MKIINDLLYHAIYINYIHGIFTDYLFSIFLFFIIAFLWKDKTCSLRARQIIICLVMTLKQILNTTKII